MKIPASHYGLAKDVRARTRSMVRQLAAGASWNEVVGADMVDTQDRPGLVVISGPSPELSHGMHFHVYLPLWKLPSRIPAAPSISSTGVATGRSAATVGGAAASSGGAANAGAAAMSDASSTQLLFGIIASCRGRGERGRPGVRR